MRVINNILTCTVILLLIMTQQHVCGAADLPSVPQCEPELQVTRTVLSSSAFGAIGVASGDVTGDGEVDVVAAAENGNSILLFTGTPSGVFTPSPPIAISPDADSARSVHLANLNSAGAADVLFTGTSAGGYFTYALSTGGGSFESLVSVSSLPGACAVTTADFNAAGGVDVVVSGTNGVGTQAELFFLANTDASGTVSLAPSVSIPAPALGSSACGLDSGDVDGDGDIDLVVGGPSGAGWMANDGSASFTVPTMFYTATPVTAVVAIDVDSDVDVDVVVGGASSSVYLFINTGSGTFNPPLVLPMVDAQDAASLVVADYNGDGGLDIIVGSFFPSLIGYFPSTTPGSAYGNYLAISTRADGVTGLASYPNGGPGSGVNLVSSSTNDDAVATYNNTVLDPVFASDPTIITSSTNGVYSVATADLDSDGDLDVVIAAEFANSISWTPNVDGTGVFGTPIIITTTAVAARKVDAADLDSDGDVDVISASSDDNTVAWYPNVDGRGSFPTKLVISNALASVRSFSIADLNNDGGLDLAVAARNADTVSVFYFLGIDATPSGFSSAGDVVDAGITGVVDVAMADFDNDGRIDVASAARFGNSIEWNRNEPGQTWAPRVNIGTPTSPRSLATGDIDGNGSADVAVAAASGNNLVWYSNDNGLGTAWTAHPLTTNLPSARDVILADLNGDGLVDVAGVSLFDDRLGVAFQVSSGVFSPLVVVDDATDGSNVLDAAIALASGDVDGDGDQDLVAGALGSDTVAWYSYLSRTALFDYTPNTQNVSVGYNPLTPPWWDCHRSSLLCILAHATTTSRCVADTLLLPSSSDFGNCRVDSHALVTHAIQMASFQDTPASPPRATINCTAVSGPAVPSGGVLFAVTPHPVPAVPLVGALSLSEVNVLGTTYAPGALDGAPGIRVSGSGASLSLTSVSVTRGSSIISPDVASIAVDVGRGGSLLIATGGAATLSGSTIEGSSASLQGGAIALRDPGSMLTMTNVTISDSVAGVGGGVHVSSQGSISGTHVVFVRNTASQGSGGAVSLESSSQGSLVSTRMMANVAAVSGGAVFASDSSLVSVTNSTLSANSARFGGGLASVSSGPQSSLEAAASSADIGSGSIPLPPTTRNTTLSSVTFDSNYASFYGGGIFACGGPVVVADGAAPWTWTGNLAFRSTRPSGDVFVCGVRDDAGGSPVYSRNDPERIPWISFASRADFNAVSTPAKNRSLTIAGPVAALRWKTRPGPELVVGDPLEGRFTAVDLLGQEVVDPRASASVTYTLPGTMVARGLEASLIVGNPTDNPPVSVKLLAPFANTTAFPVPISWSLGVASGTESAVTVVPLTGSSDLIGCPPSTGGVREVDNEGSDDILAFCRPCADGTYSATNGTLDLCLPILPCSENARDISVGGSSTATECVCKQGFFLTSVTSDGVRLCEPCPRGAVCAEGLGLPQPAKGFFPTSATTFVRCRRPACQGGELGCAKGYEGYMCNSCSSGYYTEVESCLKCPDGGSAAVSGTMVGVVVIGLVAAVMTLFPLYKSGKAKAADPKKYATEEAERTRLIPATISMVLFALQIVGLISETKAGWKGESKDATESFRIFNLDMNVFALECTVTDPYYLYALNLSTPLILFAVSFGTIFLLWAFKWVHPKLKMTFGDIGPISLFNTTLVTVAPLLHIPLSQSALKLFDCIQLPDGKYVMDADPGVECFTGGWWYVLPFGLVVTLLCVLGLPAYFFFILYRRRDRLFTEPTFTRYSGLYKVYREPFYMFAVIALGRRLLMVITVTFAGEAPLIQLGLLTAILFSQLIASLEGEPQFIQANNDCEARLSGALIALTLVGAASYAERDSQAKSSEVGIDVCTIGCIIIIVLIALWSLGVEIYEIVQEKKGNFDGEVDRAHRICKILTKELPDLEVDVAQKFQVAIDYASRERPRPGVELDTFQEYDDIGGELEFV